MGLGEEESGPLGRANGRVDAWSVGFMSERSGGRADGRAGGRAGSRAAGRAGAQVAVAGLGGARLGVGGDS